MNNFWLRIAGTGLKSLLERLKKKKGSFNMSRALKVHKLLVQIVSVLGKAIKEME